MISGASEEELDIANDIADLLLKNIELEEENKQLKEDKKKAFEFIKEIDNPDIVISRKELCKHLLKILGDKENG